MAIYNKAPYLDASIPSVLDQTFGDFELLLIDDGSTDDSPSLCDGYARKDCRIRVIHQKNAGVSAARQRGIEEAAGRYSIHIDPDDRIDNGYFEAIYRKAIETDADMVISDFLVDTDSGVTYRDQKPRSTEREQVLEDLFSSLHGSVCNKLIRQACYERYGVRFPEKLNYCEDFLVCVALLLHPVRVAHLNQAFYHYNCLTENDSLTKGFTKFHFASSLRVVVELQKLLSTTEHGHELLNSYKVRVKFLAFENQLLSAKEFAGLFPEATPYAGRIRTSRINRMLFTAACHGFYFPCVWLLHAKNRLRKNNLR
ncbi:glycosyltransferase family 2 protein [Alistipes sp.]|uniref:glycosyltransferase family 2 protein n=1 Tax=Alistipes sp. TaxID=1872444 RepID=UPI003AEF7AA6